MKALFRPAALALCPAIGWSLACSYGLTLPPDEDAPPGPAQIGKVKLRERRSILPGSISGPPPPEPGIYASQCDQLEDGGPIAGPDCITATIGCNDTIVGHTIGGVRRYDSHFYEKKFCTPATTNHNGGEERIYRLDVPDGDFTAVVTLDSPCGNLDLAAMKWTGDVCPTLDHQVSQCEMWPKPRGAREQVRLVSQNETSWLLVVEGQGEEEGAFSLSVQCWRGLY